MIKVLIVEDEKIIRQGIITLVNWGALGCEVIGDCSNGLDALTFLEQHEVDLVVTDIVMPRSNGLELCDHIKDHYPHTRMIILSSHSDFGYAQEALRYGVSDYIIKTNFIKELPPAVQKVCTELEEQKSTKESSVFRAQDLDQIKIMLLESILYDKNIDSKKADQLIALLGQDLTNYYVIFSDLEYIKTPEAGENYYASMINFYNMAFQDIWHMSFWRDTHSILTLVNFKEQNQDLNLQQLVMQANKILSTVNNYMSFQLNISISKCHRSLQELKIAYEESISNLSNMDLENYLFLYQESSPLVKEYTMPEKKEIANDFLGFIRSRELEELDTYLTQLFNNYQHTTKGLDQIKIDLLIIMSHCFRIIAEEDITSDNLEKLEEQISGHILDCSALHSLFKLINKALHELSNLTKSTQPNYSTLVLYVNNYIKENYASSIKLNDIAKKLHVNSSYLSRLYKSQTGDSIITTVNKYRITKAKEFLDTGNYLVSEVACLVGIDDPAYFTNVFTKHVGVSPKNYKLK